MATTTVRSAQPLRENRVKTLVRLIIVGIVGLLFVVVMMTSGNSKPASASSSTATAATPAADDLSARLDLEKRREKDIASSTDPILRTAMPKAVRTPAQDRLVVPASIDGRGAPVDGRGAPLSLFPTRNTQQLAPPDPARVQREKAHRARMNSSIALSYRPRAAAGGAAPGPDMPMSDPGAQDPRAMFAARMGQAPPMDDDRMARLQQLAQFAELARRNGGAMPGAAAAGGAPGFAADGQFHRRPELTANRWTGRQYLVPEGTYIDTVLVNRLSGDFAGPVEVMVSNPVYSGDRQHVLIPEGSKVMGTVQKVGDAGQRRLAVTFHRVLMPDFFSVDLDQFLGLDGVGETALKDQVNTHFLSSFFGAVAVGLVGGLAQTTSELGPLGAPATGFDAAKIAAGQSVGQSAQNMLTSRFLNRLPTITIREGARVKVYIAQDVALPAYDAHDLGNP